MVEFSPLPVIFVSSLLYTISAFDADSSDDGTKTWAIIAGFVSTVIAGVLAFMQSKGKGDIVKKYQKFIAPFFFVWWALGAGIGTFKGPFRTSGNGYFSGWIAFAASVKYAYGSNEAVRSFADRAASAMKEPAGEPADDGMYDPQEPTEAYA